MDGNRDVMFRYSVQLLAKIQRNPAPIVFVFGEGLDSLPVFIVNIS